jgi:hypothetical protein
LDLKLDLRSILSGIHVRDKHEVPVSLGAWSCMMDASYCLPYFLFRNQ